MTQSIDVMYILRSSPFHPPSTSTICPYSASRLYTGFPKLLVTISRKANATGFCWVVSIRSTARKALCPMSGKTAFKIIFQSKFENNECSYNKKWATEGWGIKKSRLQSDVSNTFQYTLNYQNMLIDPKS